MQKDDPFGQPIVYTVVLQASAQKSSLIWPLPVHAYGIRFAIWLASSFYGATASSWTGAIERLHRSVRGAERLFYLLRLPRGGAIMLPMLPTWRLSVWLFVLGGTVLLAQRPATRLRCTGASDMNGWGYKYQPASKEMPERCSGEVSAPGRRQRAPRDLLCLCRTRAAGRSLSAVMDLVHRGGCLLS